MENAAILDRVNKKFADFEIKNLSFELKKGCVTGLIGENGAGKTTLIKLLLGLKSPDSGRVTVLCEDVGKLNLIKNKLGVVFDESCFPENLNAAEINAFLKRVYKSHSEKNFKGYLSDFALPAKKAVKEYSRGMKMKLSLAAALSHGAELLILDEATSGLDPVSRDEILEVLRGFSYRGGGTVLISSHITSDLEKICDYVAFMYSGKLMFLEEKDALSEKYGLIRCSAAELAALGERCVVGKRVNDFGAEALILKEYAPSGLPFLKAGLEDIMLYYARKE